MTLYEQIEEYGITSKGKTQMLRHLDGIKLTRNQAITAKCFDCMGMFIDGRLDCKMPNCPLFPFRSYKDSLKPVIKPPTILRKPVKQHKNQKATPVATKKGKDYKTPVGEVKNVSVKTGKSIRTGNHHRPAPKA